MRFNRNRFRFLLTGCILLIFSGLLFADGKVWIDPDLEQAMQTAKAGDKIPCYVVFRERLTLGQVDVVTKNVRGRKQRQKAAVQVMKDYASARQQKVLNYVRDARSAGNIDRVENIWSINVIAFHATATAIREMADRFGELERIMYDPPIPREEAQDDGGISILNEKNNVSMKGSGAPQQGLLLINVPAVWAEGDSGQGVIVTNVDGGADWRHADLVNRMWNNLGEDIDGDGRTIEQVGSSWVFDPDDVNGIDDDGNGRVDDFVGWNFSNNSNDPSTSANSHGTSTGGILVGDGTNGTETGVAPRARMIDCNINSAGSSGWWAAYQYAFESGSDVTTSSYSLKWPSSPDYAMFRAINDMELAAGTVHTNSTSNDGQSLGTRPIPYNISAPGNSPGPWVHPDQTLVGGLSSVIGSANVNAFSDVIDSFSPHGPAAWEDIQSVHSGFPWTMPLSYQDYPYETSPGSMGLIKPDVAAPGASTTSLSPGGGYSGFGGTSGATPHLAGVAALMLSANPDLTVADVSRIMQTTSIEKGDPGKDNRYGAGRVDAYAAYQRALAEAGSPAAATEFAAYSDYSTPDGMQLTWDDPTVLLNGDPLDPSAFTVYIVRDETVVDSVAGGSESYDDTGLIDGQEYFYQIYAKVDSSGRQSNAVEASWIAGGSPLPNGVSGFSVAGSVDEVAVSWVNPSTNIDGTPMDDFAGINLYQNGSLVTTFSRSSADTGAVDSATYAPSTAGFYDWQISVVDDEAAVNESELTVALGTPLSVPLDEAFDVAGEPNPGLWINSNADVNDRASNPISGGLALNLNGKPVGEDIIDLKPIDLSGQSGTGMELSYWWQPQGNGNTPEPEDSLRVYFKNDQDEWVLVRAYEGRALQDFEQEVIDIETAPNGGGNYFHGQFQVRFRSTGGSNAVVANDDWFVDNVYLGTIPLSVEDDILPTSYAVSPNYPNPFNPATTINYQLPETGETTLVIYNMLGQKVRTLVKGQKAAGQHKVVWNGLNDAGFQVSSGIYFYRFEAGDFSKVHKMILLK